MVDFLVAKCPDSFSSGKIGLRYLSPKLHHILHTEAHKKQRNVSPRAHSGGNLKS